MINLNIRAKYKKIEQRFRQFNLSMRMKISLSLLSIAVILLTSSIISILEYSRMSNYVSELIADNIKSINVAQNLASATNEYNLQLLSLIGDTDSTNTLPEFNQEEFTNHCDSLRASLTSRNLGHLADSVEYAYSAYMLTSLMIIDEMKAGFIHTSTWYFERLQPVYNELRRHIDNLNSAIYDQLKRNSATFDRGFYRSIIPGAVAVGGGILLVLLLLFFILVYYVNPLYKMLSGLQNYRSLGKKYTYTFEGDDQLAELNEGIIEVTEENVQLRKRVRALRDAMSQRDLNNQND